MERYRCAKYEALEESYDRGGPDPQMAATLERDVSAQLALAMIGRDRLAKARALQRHMNQCGLCR